MPGETKTPDSDAEPSLTTNPGEDLTSFHTVRLQVR